MNSRQNKGLGPARAIGFLLSQIGSYVASGFARELKPLGLSPHHAGILRIVAQEGGLSQKALAEKLSILPSRLVVLLDELEEKKLLVRAVDPNDRRSTALQLSESASPLLQEIRKIGMAQHEQLCAALDKDEQQDLVRLLLKMAGSLGLSEGVHPGFRDL